MKIFAYITLLLSPFILCSCWQVAAARAAKKRTTQTGYVVGTIQKEAGIEDPLGRKQQLIDLSDKEEDKKVDKGER